MGTKVKNGKCVCACVCVIVLFEYNSGVCCHASHSVLLLKVTMSKVAVSSKNTIDLAFFYFKLIMSKEVLPILGLDLFGF